LKTAASVVSIPKVGILSAPMDTTLLSGDTLATRWRQMRRTLWRG
jgi:hypothetical protein